jgi:hypothetical protein
MIPGSAIRQILRLGLELITRNSFLSYLSSYPTLRVIGVQICDLGEPDADIQFVMRLLLVRFEASVMISSNLASLGVVTQNVQHLG